MASNKMVHFYQQCTEKGYVDMTDATQSLKAKVIASDLGLNYKNIEKLYSDAKQAYEDYVAAEERRIQALEAEKAKKAVNGVLLFTLQTGDGEIRVYRRPDESVYCEGKNTEGRIESVKIGTESGAFLSYDYHPSQVVYTGASSGGIHMGGTHTTQAYYSEKVNTSGNGNVVVQYGGKKSTVKSVKLADSVAKAFKRDEIYNKWGRSFNCTKESSYSSTTTKAIIMSNAGYYDKMGMLSAAADRERLSMADCKEIAHFLNRIIAHHYPISDEQIYEQGKQLMAKENSADLQQAANRFSMIRDYQDSEELLAQTLAKYEVVLQAEKERKILEQEERSLKRQKTLKKVMPLLVAGVVLLAVLLGVGGFAIKSAADKKQAEKVAASIEIMENLIGKTYYRKDGLSITFKEDGTAVGKWNNGYYSTYEVMAEDGDPVVLTFTLIPERSKVESDDPVSTATWDREKNEITYSRSVYTPYKNAGGAAAQ